MHACVLDTDASSDAMLEGDWPLSKVKDLHTYSPVKINVVTPAQVTFRYGDAAMYRHDSTLETYNFST